MNLKKLLWSIFFKGNEEYDLSKTLQNCYVAMEEVEDINANFTVDIEELNEEIDRILKLYKLLKIQEMSVKKPDFLTTVMPYQPKTKITTKTGVKSINISPTDIYSCSTAIRRLVKNFGLKELYLKDKKVCATKIWDYVIKALTYEFDDGEDWRFSTISLGYTKGDCEDGTILFLDLAREAGFRADEIFNACGYVTKKSGDKFGHSYPILNYGEGWFIYESTLDTLPKEPMKFLGSNYGADWGLANWQFWGRLLSGRTQI